MSVVGFISEKGGVGKTTTCYHVAIGLQRFHQKRVLVIDADYQRGGITGRFFPDLIEGFRNGTLPDNTLFNKYQQLYSASSRTPDVTIRQSPEHVDVVVADTRLSNVTTDKLPSTNNIRSNNTSILNHMKVIDYVIDAVRDRYDYVLIDSHPEISDVLKSIIYASDFCVSPVKLDLQSSIGVPTVISEINSVNSDVALLKQTLDPAMAYNPTRFAGAIGAMVREYGGIPKQSELDELQRLHISGPVFNEYVTEGDGLRRAAQDRVPVYDVAGANATKQSNHLQNLTREFLRRCP